MVRNKETVRISIDIPAELHAYLMLLAAGEGLTLEQFVLKCLPSPGKKKSVPDQMQVANKIMRQNRGVLKKLSED